MVGTVVVGRLWALTVALNAWFQGRVAQVWWLTAFQAVSFGVALLVWLAAHRER